MDDLVSALSFQQTFSEDPEVEIHIITQSERYPAIDALFQIGKPALPALCKVIASDAPASINSKNATLTIILIFRDDPQQGVNFLDDQASKAPPPVAASRFRAAAAQAKRSIPHQ